MENKSPKPWEKPWTTQQIVDNASKWSLAGDVAVLKTLEAFSEVKIVDYIALFLCIFSRGFLKERIKQTTI